MATPLRYALIFLLWAMVAVIYAPLIPAALTLISPALSLTHWQALFADPQLPQALLATLVSTTIAAVGALLIALLVIVALWPGPKWQRMCARLPWLLAIPHVAFATSALLLFADGGLLYDYFPYFTPPMDRFGIGLGLTLAVKESAFLLWILAAVLSEKWLLQQVIVLDSLGYSRWQCLNWLLLPSVAPALAMAMLAIVAWSLSVVDVAIILGPGNPPTLAVISWQWLTQGDIDQQTKGALASLLLMLLLAAYVLLSYLLWRSWRRTIPRVDGVRKPATPLLPGNTLAIFLPLTGVLCVVLLAILADQSTINSEALINSLTMGLVATFIALLLLLLWLEWGPQRRQLWLWLPILLPALPLVAGQYTLALWLKLDGSWTAVVWGHLLWVMPWMLFILQPAWQRIDSRLILIAQTLGWSRAKIFFYVKCPLMLRPVLIAFAVGFAVGIAQYMPTLWLGAGRFPTAITAYYFCPDRVSRKMGRLCQTRTPLMLCVKNVSLRLPESRLLTNVNFTVDKGDIVTLMGPSGCGKSTLFSWMIGALAEQFSCTGELWLNEQRIDILPTAQRQIGILFQDALLFDQFSVGQNLLLALPATLKGNARRNAVNDALERSGLEGAFHQDPATLSGGQRARVALLRALLAQPKALLLDEPFSRLDVALRDNFRQWVFSEVRALAIPVVQVTHDLQDVPADSSVLDMAQWSENYNKLR